MGKADTSNNHDMKTPPERKPFTIKGMNIPTAPESGSCSITHHELATSKAGIDQAYPLLAIAAKHGSPHLKQSGMINPDERYTYAITENVATQDIVMEWTLKQ